MATEPERPIEKLLHAAAQKRRDEAGAPFQLHPANRRVLQGEVARTFPKAGRAPRSFTSLIVQMWPRFAGALAILAVLGMAVWLLVPLPDHGRQEALLAKNVPLSEPAPAKTPLLPTAAPSVSAVTSPAGEAKNKSATVAFDRAAEVASATPSRRAAVGGEAHGGGGPAAPAKSRDADRLALAASAPLGGREEAARKQVANSAGGPASEPAVVKDGPITWSLSPSDGERVPKASEGLVGGPDAQRKAVAAAQNPTTTVNGALGSRYGLAGGTASPASAPQAPAAAFGFAAKPAEAPAMAADESDTLADKKTDQPTAQFKDEAAAALGNRLNQPAGSADALSKTFNERLKQANGNAIGLRFIRVLPGSKDSVGLADRSTAEHPVLASFSVEQAGHQLRIVDGDGSVYRGYLQLATAAKRARSPKSESAAAARTLQPANSASEAQAPSSLGLDRLAPQTYSFRVAGTNRSLNQPIVFTGNLLNATNLVVSLPAGTNGGLSSHLDGFLAGPAQPSVEPLLHSRIAGKVVIGSGKPIEINALPSNP